MSDFPVFDLEKYFSGNIKDKIRYAKQVDEICQSSGFLAIRNHGIKKSIIKNIWSATESFFSLSSEEKNHSKVLFDGYPYGYIGTGKEALAASKGVSTPPDLKESFNGGPIRKPIHITDPDALAFCYAQTIWPTQPKNFKLAWEAYYKEMEILASKIMKIFAVALNLDETFFESYIDEPISALRALNYPAQNLTPQTDQLRAGAHSDYGSLTILLPQEYSQGLEILSPNGNWKEVPAIPDTLIINIGDLMATWTNDRWVSTLHRVINKNSASKRQSIAYFHQPNWDAEIKCLPNCINDNETPKYPSTLSGPYLMKKFQSTNR